jgi:hypothetical protein
VTDPTYEFFKRYRETLAERTTEAYANWRSVRSGTTTRAKIHNAQTEFDRRELLQLYYWMAKYGDIFSE